MNPPSRSLPGWALAAVLLLIIPFSIRAAEVAGSVRPVLYDTAAEGPKQIEAALKTAQAENKRVILKFGANWCGWCHQLSGLLKTNSELAAIMKENYVLVLIDVDKGHNAETVKKYGNPTQFGLPALVVLDRDGKQLTIQDTGKLEDGNHHDIAKVRTFLETWRGPKAETTKN